MLKVMTVEMEMLMSPGKDAFNKAFVDAIELATGAKVLDGL